MEEFTGEAVESPAADPPARVYDLDEDGPEVLAQFGLQMKVV